MNQAQAHTLEVSGARLYFEAEGNGPALVLIPGANGDNQIQTTSSFPQGTLYGCDI